MSSAHILKFSCRDRPGIVAKVAGLLFNDGGNILDAQQFDDLETGRFFMRVLFDQAPSRMDGFRRDFAVLAREHEMDFTLRPANERRRVLLLVSKLDHCLGDLLYRVRIGELNMQPVGVVSNHPREALNLTVMNDIPYHHLPVTPETKLQQEAQIARVIGETGAELVVLARYMQVLSSEFCASLEGRCINIHHSFLPAFKGAKPYHQSQARGVKLIGATAHYVTSDLDEGPIICQDVEAVTHADTANSLVRKGRDIERRVLARAVHHHIEDRVLINGSKTVVFA
jgi:formyltetrahydrofolate deformylase